ncbi:MAG: C10 family peptidase [Dysgonamonadaceae bacterium]|jgi:uncharacterized repeat protein (TIGR02543 family)|nr:C10 family peptidase [Dysgonamonadaceae bacterium]
MKKIYIVLTVFLLSTVYLHCEQISTTESASIVNQIIGSTPTAFNGSSLSPSSLSVNLAYTVFKTDSLGQPVTSGEALYRVFNVGDSSGFVILAADDRVEPLIGYSGHGTYDPDSLPPNMVVWMDGVAANIAYAIDNDLQPSEEVLQAWASTPEFGEDVVAPLLTTQWSYWAPYNDSVPTFINKNGNFIRPTPGCSAIAMAQIMKYWNYPEEGADTVVSYSSIKQKFNLSVDFSQSYYNWAIMPNSFDSSESQESKAAVAKLMYDCGVSVKTDYGINDSTSSSARSKYVIPAFKRIFNYYNASGSLIDLDAKKLEAELNAKRPVYMTGTPDPKSIAGHAFICDGYTDKGFYHFNWGQGEKDGYYSIGSAGTSDDPLNRYQHNRNMIIGIRPPTGILLDTAYITFPEDSTYQLKAINCLTGTIINSILWSSSDSDIAEVSSTGLVTGIKGGEATIMAVDNQGRIATCYVTVTVAVKGITLLDMNIIISDDISIEKPMQYPIYPIFSPANASNKKCTFETGNSATVQAFNTGTGGYKLLVSNPGTTVIKVTTEDGGFSDSCTINVQRGILPEYVTVTFNSNGGTVLSPQAFKHNTKISSPIPTRPTYIFEGWYREATFINKWNISTDRVLEDITLYAKWTCDIIFDAMVTFDSNGGSDVDYLITGYNTYIYEPYPPVKEANIFAGWYSDPALTERWYFDEYPVMGNMTLYAKWTFDIIFDAMVTFDSNGGSDVDYLITGYNTYIYEPYPPVKGANVFAGWYSDPALTERWYFDEYPVMGNMTLYAKWYPVSYTVNTTHRCITVFTPEIPVNVLITNAITGQTVHYLTVDYYHTFYFPSSTCIYYILSIGEEFSYNYYFTKTLFVGYP